MSHETITFLVLGKNKNIHTITEKDQFLDNGLCVQLIKETPIKIRFQGDSQVLSESDIKQLSQFKKITYVNHEFGNCELFSITNN